MGKHRSVQKKRGEWKVKKKATGQYRMKTTGREPDTVRVPYSPYSGLDAAASVGGRLSF
jgi:hypothetical protein